MGKREQHKIPASDGSSLHRAGAGSVVAAFTEDQVESLTGVSKSQLRYWDNTNFFSPSTFDVYKGRRFGRIYSFRDLVSLKVLNDLRNKAHVPLPQLREIKTQWAAESDEIWLSRKLYAVNKRVVSDSPGGLKDALSGQQVFHIVIQAEYETLQKNVVLIFGRAKDTVGKIDKQRSVSSNKAVIAGTRIPVRAIKEFKEDGYSVDEILREYPSLTKKDVQAAIKYKETA